MRTFVAIVMTGAVFTSAFLTLAKTSYGLPFPPDVAVDLIYTESFDHVEAWDEFIGQDGVELRVQDGTYRAYTPAEGYVWGLNTSLHENVVLEVEAVPMSMFVENGFGLMCRADPTNDGDGYYFMVTGTGY